MSEDKKVYSERDVISAAMCVNAFICELGGSIRIKEILDPHNSIVAINTTSKKIYTPDLEERFVGILALLAIDHADIDISSARITLTEEGKNCGSKLNRVFVGDREAML